MVVFEKLIEDHNTVKAQLNRSLMMMRQGEPANPELIKQICSELILHSKLEEDFLYPVLRKLDDTRHLIEEAYKEHTQVREILDRLQKMDVTTQREEIQTQLKKLQDALLHHIEEEEGETFPAAQDLLPPEEIQRIDMQMGELRQREMRRQQVR